MPKQVSSWRRSLDLCDSELRSLLEKEILTTAHRELGDFKSKALFSLPPKHKARGEIHLGTVLYDGERWPAGLSRTELTQNMAIFGRSGAGKTNLAFHLLQQFSTRGIPWLFLDWKRTARHLLPNLSGRVDLYTPGRSLSPFPFNPFSPPKGLESATYANHVVDVMGDAYGLGDAARSVLHKALTACYEEGLAAPGVADVHRRVDALPDRDRMRGWKATAIRSLEALTAFDFGTDAEPQATRINRLLNGRTILELDGLSPSNKKFFIPILALWIFHSMLPESERETLRLALFVEEAHHVFFEGSGYRESLMNQLLRQCREIGIGIVVVDQHPSQISSAALGNTYTSVCMNLKDPKDLSKAAGVSGLTADQKRHFAFLPTGQGVVKLQDRWRRPFLVRIPLVAVRKGSVTDADLAEALRTVRGLSALSNLVQRPVPGRPADRRPLEAAGTLGELEMRFLDDILLYPDDGVDARYKRLGLSVHGGHRLKQRLVRIGILEEQRVSVGRTRRNLLRSSLTPARSVQAHRTGRAESLVHEFWKRQVARDLGQAGYRVRLEAPRGVGRVDVLATKGKRRIAVEIETGQSNALHNTRQNILSGFDHQVILVTTPRALQSVEGSIARAGLLGPRVTIALAGSAPLAELIGS